MNPVTALFDPLEKLINEHGSASILRDRVELFKDQLSILKEKFTVLETEKKDIEAENLKLKNENIKLKEKIRTYETSPRDTPPDGTEVEILQYLANQEHFDITPDQVAQSLNSNLQIIIFHLENLRRKCLIEDRPIAPFDHSPQRFWSLTQDGRSYLIKNNLIS